MFGNRSEDSELAVARLLTVTRTCQLQQLNVLAYLTAAVSCYVVVRAWRHCFGNGLPPELLRVGRVWERTFLHTAASVWTNHAGSAGGLVGRDHSANPQVGRYIRIWASERGASVLRSGFRLRLSAGKPKLIRFDSCAVHHHSLRSRWFVRNASDTRHVLGPCQRARFLAGSPLISQPLTSTSRHRDVGDRHPVLKQQACERCAPATGDLLDSDF